MRNAFQIGIKFLFIMFPNQSAHIFSGSKPGLRRALMFVGGGEPRLPLWLRAAAGAAAGHAAIAASVADHDGSAGVAAGGIAHVVEVLHGVGGVVDATVL